MNSTSPYKNSNEYGVVTRALAGFCHGCGVSPYAATKPDTTFERGMRWHRTCCPASSAHIKVYGLEPLPGDSIP